MATDISLQGQNAFDDTLIIGDTTTPTITTNTTQRIQKASADGEIDLGADAADRGNLSAFVVNVRFEETVAIDKGGGTVRIVCSSGAATGVAAPIETSAKEDAGITDAIAGQTVQFVHHPGGRFVVVDATVAGATSPSVNIDDVWLTPYRSNNQ